MRTPAAGRAASHTPLSARLAGTPHAGGPWSLFKGQVGVPYLLYADGGNSRLSATFGGGGQDGKTATFIRSLLFTRGAAAQVTANLAQLGKDWVLQGG